MFELDAQRAVMSNAWFEILKVRRTEEYQSPDIRFLDKVYEQRNIVIYLFAKCSDGGATGVSCVPVN